MLEAWVFAGPTFTLKYRGTINQRSKDVGKKISPMDFMGDDRVNL